MKLIYNQLIAFLSFNNKFSIFNLKLYFNIYSKLLITGRQYRSFNYQIIGFRRDKASGVETVDSDKFLKNKYLFVFLKLLADSVENICLRLT